MSRELTKYVRPKEKNPEVEEVMNRMGCSEPVARNMLKMRKFGMGPLASQPAASDGHLVWRPGSPPRLGSTGSGMAADQKRKLQEREERLREQDDTAFFEPVERGRASRKQNSSVGIQRLGPVMARTEAVDPLEKKGVPDEKVQEAREEAERKLRALEEAGRKAATERKSTQEKAEEEARKRRRRKPKRKRRAGEEEPTAGDSESASAEEGAAEDEAAREAARGRGSGSGLMTEAEVLAHIGKDRRTERGSVRAAVRVQKELQEWEKVKAHDPEYYRAPKFALCFSAETGRKKKY